jgi:4-hydroxythreonine-4-phosphate dehydrogenase
MFYKWEEKGYDAFVALYHDQGMIPFKAGGFEKGVNMTIGLPVVRTSVCHGTAYDIAGTGTAETGSLESAFALAVECCLARRARK